MSIMNPATDAHKVIARSNPDLIAANAPEELKQLQQWVVWKIERSKTGKWTKVPYAAADPARHAATNRPETWGTFDQAIHALRTHPDVAGVGFVFADGGGLAGVDIDNCRDESGNVKPWASEIVRDFASYMEVSPSGRGIKVFVRGSKSSSKCKASYHDGDVELYGFTRYFTVTGAIVPGGTRTVDDCQESLQRWEERILGTGHPAALAAEGPAKPEPDSAPDPAPRSAPEHQGGLNLSPSAIAPPLKLEALIENDPRFRLTWERKRADLKDQSSSSYDMALANFAAAAEWTRQEAASLIIEWRRRHGEGVAKSMRLDYMERTLRKAFDEAGHGDASGADSEAGSQTKKPGLTKRLADAILKAHYFARDAGGKLYFFSDGFYKPGGETAVKKAVKHLLEEWKLSKAWSSHQASEAVEYIRVDAPELWDAPQADVMNLSNGLLNVRERKLKPHDPAFLSAVQLPVAYDPAAACPAWVKFIHEVFPEDAVDLAWQIVAWVMIPDNIRQLAILLLGEGANGKSTFLAAINAFIGRRNVTGLSLHKLESDKFSVARLVGKLANICPDLPSAHLAGTSVFKALTGGDVLAAERKYADSFEFSPFAKLIFSANHAPRSQDSSQAFFRRWLVVPFERTFEPSQQIPRAVLDARLSSPDELSGVLNLALQALRGMCENGFLQSESLRKAWDEFRQSTDPLAVWLDANTLEGPDLLASKDELLKAYNADAERDHRPPMTATALGRALRRLRPAIQDAQRTWNTKLCWVWLGIGLRSYGD